MANIIGFVVSIVAICGVLTTFGLTVFNLGAATKMQNKQDALERQILVLNDTIGEMNALLNSTFPNGRFINLITDGDTIDSDYWDYYDIAVHSYCEAECDPEEFSVEDIVLSNRPIATLLDPTLGYIAPFDWDGFESEYDQIFAWDTVYNGKPFVLGMYAGGIESYDEVEVQLNIENDWHLFYFETTVFTFTLDDTDRDGEKVIMYKEFNGTLPVGVPPGSQANIYVTLKGLDDGDVFPNTAVLASIGLFVYV